MSKRITQPGKVKPVKAGKVRNTDLPCSVAKCPRKRTSGAYCSRHYSRYYKHGNARAKPARSPWRDGFHW